jgi:2-dehydro-3-deoxygalactonokinase
MSGFRTRIVVDWGTSSFRAYLFDGDGAILRSHRAAAGILSVADGRFEDVLRREIGPWLADGADILLSGMITSRNGWMETPYAATPAGLDDLRAGVVRRRLDAGVALSFLPGVRQRTPTPDVMRGEEIQIFGAFGPQESGVAVLPGTHSKWARVEAGRIVGFRSFMAGEVYAALKDHTILGRLIPAERPPFSEAAFVAGVELARAPDSAGLLGDIFSVRSGVLLGAFAAEEIADRLSGIVIGHEIAGAGRLGWTGGEVKLIGAAELCARYAAALGAMGIAHGTAREDAVVEGFRRLALA